MEKTELQALMADLHPESFGWAVACCQGDRMRAEDVLQIAYVKVLEGRAQFHGKSTFKTWFFGVVRNVAREEWRRHQLRRIGLLRYESPSQGESSNPKKDLVRKESIEEIRVALEKLSPRQQEVLHLVFYQEFTIEGAAEVMAISVGSARTHYQRGKKRLRGGLNKEEGREDEE